MPEIAFVPANGLGRTTTEDRKLIRSHCMLGKNKKYKGKKKNHRDHGDAIRQQSRTAASVSDVAIVGGPVEINSPSGSSAAATLSEAKTPARPDVEYTLSTLSSPVKPPSVFSLFPLAREIDTLSRELLYKYFFVARQVFYPIQFCVYSDASLYTWFEWLFHDAAYLESVLLGMSAMDDFFKRRPPSKLTYSHMRATITGLNNRLSNSSLSLADSTIAVVMGLAELTGMLSDDTAAKAHVAGFQRIVRLRGGVNSFAENTKLQIKIGRFDLIYALRTGKPPQFFTDPISWSPIFDPLSPVTSNSGHIPEDADTWPSSTPTSPSTLPVDFLHDSKLTTIFHDLHHFTSLLNTSSPNPSQYNPPLLDTQYQTYICSIQYRLLRLQNKLTSILDECARLAMLALLTTTFQVAGKRAPYPHLERRFREFCRAGIDPDRASPGVVLWLLVVGALAVFHVDGNGDGDGEDGEDAGWMGELWRTHISPVGWGWEEAHRRLRGRFPWIAVLHDEAGRVVFERMCRKARECDVDGDEVTWDG